MKNTIICGKNIYKTFTQSGEKTQILLGIDVDIYEGDFTVVMGSSGAGKSTLLYALSGMDTITGGSVTFKGQEISMLSEKKMAQLRADEFGFVFQQTHLVSNLTLFENVAVAGFAAKAGSTKEGKRIPGQSVCPGGACGLRRRNLWKIKSCSPI